MDGINVAAVIKTFKKKLMEKPGEPVNVYYNISIIHVVLLLVLLLTLFVLINSIV